MGNELIEIYVTIDDLRMLYECVNLVIGEYDDSDEYVELAKKLETLVEENTPEDAYKKLTDNLTTKSALWNPRD